MKLTWERFCVAVINSAMISFIVIVLLKIFNVIEPMTVEEYGGRFIVSFVVLLTIKIYFIFKPFKAGEFF